jgi:hypothetical protein
MVKDVTYYNTKASFGVKDIGYTKDVVGGGDPIAPKGKYKSSGYGDMPKTKVVKENLENKYSEYSNDALTDMIINLSRYEDTEDMIQMVKDELEKRKKSKNIKEGKDETISSKVENLVDKVVKWYEKHPNPKMKERINSVEKTLENLMSKTIGKDAISYSDFEKQIKNKFNLPFEDPQYSKFKKSSLNEGKSKKSTLDSHIKEIEKISEITALEAKINAVKEAIEMRESKIKIAESEDVAEMIDESMVKKIKNEIKLLEKYKMQCEKQLGKLQPESKETVVDNEDTSMSESDDNTMNEY